MAHKAKRSVNTGPKGLGGFRPNTYGTTVTQVEVESEEVQIHDDDDEDDEDNVINDAGVCTGGTDGGVRRKVEIEEEILYTPVSLGATPPYSTDQMRRYLAQLYLAKVGKTTADHVRNAVDWWHEVHNTPSPCNESIVRLCDAMHRDLPKQGNKARRPLTGPPKRALNY